ncbi:zinc metalloprotease [Nonomuraea jiangxiensis]|uniref:Pregnancy-associated plasma protein-A n=1 Tax=Nonomuraea jiangxiensis TaxID=633440 RepID=A0A1G8V8Q2_9ACTN|nr:zinc metalloprotease [Nonomuraea jiangxiensis]SDJ62274.1 Pregnancy-associated plasma protein-A [Nonomuraea jiangxiensis]
MARRATAVSLACLLAAGLVPLLRPGAALAAGCAAATSAAPATPARSPHPRSPKPGDVARVMAELDERLAGMTPSGQITVPTRVHVIVRDERQVSDEVVRAQIDTLNSAYGGVFGGVDTGVRFRLDGIDVKRHAAWFTDPVGHEKAMKNALHQGGADTLNLYIAQLNQLMLGFASYPYWYEGAPELDGVVIDWRSLPGGAMSNYNLGFTGVHEIGHWLGLFHTFENGCEPPGDGVEDTPAEARPSEACPPGRDTCTRPGEDPSHNFMDYAHDRCMSEFTRGQAVRMHEMWAVYRNTADA